MIRPAVNILYQGDKIGDLYEMLDTLHSVASEGQLQTFTTLNEQELVDLLRDIVFTAQETISEIEKHHKKTRSAQPVLRLVNKDAGDMTA
jgi:hypothetical protein